MYGSRFAMYDLHIQLPEAFSLYGPKALPFTHKWGSRKRLLFVITEQTNFDEHEKSKHFWGQAS